MITPQDSTVLLAISNAGAEGGDWPAMLRAIVEHLRADRAEFRQSERGWNDRGPIAAPLPEVFTGLRPGRVYTGAELDERRSGTAAQPDDQRAIGLRLPEGIGWLVLTRLQAEFRAVESAGLAALAPHVAQAASVAARVNEAAERARQAEQILRRIGVGTIGWDSRGHAVARDAIAHDLLSNLRSEVTIRAAPILQSLAPGVDLLVLPDESGNPVGYLRACNLPLPPPDLLAQALSISLPEARLARALGQGLSLLDAAEHLGLSLETARFYSKQIYAKTGLRGQSALMRRLWTSALALAPAHPHGHPLIVRTPRSRNPTGPA